MGKKHSGVDAYIAKSADFAKPILNHLRALVHAGCPDVEEELKWSFPHFTYKGMFCSMAAFKEHCAFGFWKGQLLFAGNPKAMKAAEEAMGYFGRIASLTDLPKDKVILGYLKEAIRLNDEGIQKPAAPKSNEKKELVIPDCLIQALKQNKKAQEVFDGFSYSHKKEYVEWITEAKTEATQQKRLATTLEWLVEGKSRHWKYQNC